MKIFGIDFTSTPGLKKPITCAQCRLDEEGLFLENSFPIKSFDEFEDFLRQPGPWIAGMDFPFGQPRKLIENIGWPASWEGYVRHVSKMTKPEFVETLAKYREGREKGNKQHLRRTDELANSRSPMMLYGVPVGKMFFEGAHRLLEAGVSILPCHQQNDPRCVVEVYPALVARRWIGSLSYKNDDKKKQTLALQSGREGIVTGLRSQDMKAYYGFDVHFSKEEAQKFISDGSGDELDALLCAIQAGWAYIQRDSNYSIPVNSDLLEGWIVSPEMAKL